MMADKISTMDGTPHMGRCFGKKAVMLIVVCCLGFLAYSLNCLRSNPVSPQTLPTHGQVNATSVHAVLLKLSSATQKTVQDHVGPPDTLSPSKVVPPSSSSSEVSNPVERDEKINILSSSSVEEIDADEEDWMRAEEKVAFVPQGTWQRRLPLAIIIGVKKGGTRALLSFLKEHPEVAVSTTEMHFFDRQYDRGMEWYRKKMPYSYANQLTMEKTPGYFVTPEVPQRIYRMSHDVKFLVVVREPIARAISDHAQSLSKGRTTPFERKAMLGSQGCDINEDWSAIRIGLYADHLARWLKYYPISQFFFVNGENLVANPGQEMEKVQDFLNIGRAITRQSFVFNETKGFPCLRGNEDGEEKCLGESKGRKHQPIHPEVRQCLAKFYQPYNERFYKMTGKDFHWDDKID